MKTSDKLSILVFVALVISGVSRAHASECNLTLKATKPSARTAQLGGVNFNAKQLMALRSVCIVEIKHLTKSDKLEAYKQKLEREEADMRAMFGTQAGE